MRLAVLLAAALAAAPLPAGTSASGTVPRLELDARVVWRAPDARFGGFSGIHLDEGGASLMAISDRGSWATGEVERGADGRMTGARLTGIGPLRTISGIPVEGAEIDAEALAVDGEGRAWVSFEGFHRVRRHDRIDGPASGVPSHPDFRSLQQNSGLEALAVDAAGRLYAIPERSGAWQRPFPVYRFRDGSWDRTLSVPRVGPFLVVDADFGPDGRLYLLERDFRWIRGFSTRIRSFALGPDGFGDELVLYEQSERGSIDNFEGISVWRDAVGRTRVTLISDDNFIALAATVLEEFVLIED